MDARITAFENEIELRFAALTELGYAKAPAVVSGTLARRPYSRTITFTSEVAEISCALALGFAGEDAVVTRAQTSDGFRFEESATAHKGHEVRMAIQRHAEAVLAHLRR